MVCASETNAQGLIEKDDVTNRCYGMTVIENNASSSTQSRARFAIYNSNTAYQVDSSTKVDDGSWHHIVGEFTPSTHVKIYVDGQLEATNTTSIPSSIDNDSEEVHLGTLGGYSTIFLNGQLTNDLFGESRYWTIGRNWLGTTDCLIIVKVQVDQIRLSQQIGYM